MNLALNDMASLYRRPRIWLLMGAQDIRMRYRRSLIGPFWISLSMSIMILAMALLYSEIFHQPFREYLSYLACGVLVWTLISSLILEGANIVVEGEANLRNLPFEVSLLAARVAYRGAIVFFHNLLAVVVLLVLFGAPPTWAVLLMPFGVVVILICGFFAALILGPLCARFRDIQQVLGSVVQIAFFVTPIMWHADMVKSRPLLIQFNPFYHLVEVVRGPLLGRIPTPENYLVSLGVAALLAIGAVLIVSVTRKRIYLWL